MTRETLVSCSVVVLALASSACSLTKEPDASLAYCDIFASTDREEIDPAQRGRIAAELFAEKHGSAWLDAHLDGSSPSIAEYLVRTVPEAEIERCRSYLTWSRPDEPTE